MIFFLTAKDAKLKYAKFAKSTHYIGLCVLCAFFEPYYITYPLSYFPQRGNDRSSFSNYIFYTPENKLLPPWGKAGKGVNNKLKVIKVEVPEFRMRWTLRLMNFKN